MRSIDIGIDAGISSAGEIGRMWARRCCGRAGARADARPSARNAGAVPGVAASKTSRSVEIGIDSGIRFVGEIGRMRARRVRAAGGRGPAGGVGTYLARHGIT